jgi:hypothetical protein
MTTSISSLRLLALFAVAAAASCGAPRAFCQLSHSQEDVTNAIIVWNSRAAGADAVDQASYEALIASLGFAPQRVSVGGLAKARLDQQALLLIPKASSRMLSAGQVRQIVKAVENGARLVTGGGGGLAGVLGLKLGKSQKVKTLIDHNNPDNRLHWADGKETPSFAEVRDSSVSVLYSDSSTGHSLGVKVDRGKGHCIVLAQYLDDLSGKGYSRFPTVANVICLALHCRPPFQRRAADVYFDPGYRFGIPIEDLAARWRHWGIRAVHASAWYYNGAHPYDYKKLIDAAHKNGILVYAWLEWPHVGKGFWDKHPEWRQKTALLQDAKLDWLNLMDLQNPDCMNAALKDLSGQLQLDWDGIDVAEFTITGAGGEALQGPSRPEYFTSFGTTMRKEFAAVGGFDPLELENPASEHFWKRDSVGLGKFYAYRQTVNNRLLRRVVQFVDSLNHTGKRDWELIHTIVDNSIHPEFDELLGFDLKTTLSLAKEFGITLNVEDPYMEWSEPPGRYRRLREWLVSLIPDRNSMIDINVVPTHTIDQPGFPSEQPTGTELLQQIQAAAERGGRVCFYAESTIFEQDWPLISGAMAGGTVMNKSGDGWEVTGPAAVVLRSAIGNNSVFVDGKPWPAHGANDVLLPAGKHQVSIQPPPASRNSDKKRLRLLALTGELTGCMETQTGIEVQYTSPSRCLLTLNGPAMSMQLDGISVTLPMLKKGRRHSIVAPSGSHRISISM